MNYSFKYLRAFYVIIFSLLLLFSCSEDEEGQGKAKSEPGLEIESSSEFGNILVDQDNQALYFFANDVGGESACNGGCADVWPPLTGEVYNFDLGEGLNSSDFGTITREDGQKQITFKGWPLYYFSPEGDGILEAPGEIEGDGKNNVFYVAKPDYSIMVGRQAVEEDGDALLYLVDDKGVSLYFNTGDEENTSNCSGGCAGVWPPFKSPENLVLPSLLEQGNFSVVNRDDELGPQLAVFGSPLYHFSPDEQVRGNVLGQAGGPAQSFFVLDPTNK